MEFNETYREY